MIPILGCNRLQICVFLALFCPDFQCYRIDIVDVVLRPTISLDTPLGHTVPILNGGVHGENEDGARSVSSRKKMEVVLRVLRGEDLDLVSRETGMTAATVSAWRDQFVASGQAGLKSRAADGCDDELARLKALVGDLTMRLELSREAVQRLRGGAPLATGRSTR